MLWNFREKRIRGASFIPDPPPKKRCGRHHTPTPRQREVIQLLAEGKSMKQAADVLKVSIRTVAFHKYQIMREMEFKTNADLIQFAIRKSIVAI
jgi:DNA-binding NarL/FixJ family response regulator